MSKHTRTILVTGGAGFIGSHLIRWLIENTPHLVINFDCLTYAANLDALENCPNSERYRFEKADTRDLVQVRRIFKKHRPDCIMHLAAESHVDHSIESPQVFAESNIMGTLNLLEACRELWTDEKLKEQYRFINVSTDEVFGSLDVSDSACDEHSAYAPRSPYSATKAAADHLVHAWGATYQLPVITTRCSNNYGPWQYPEKLIPVVINAAAKNSEIPVYGTGKNIRDWIHVTDHVRALGKILEHGKLGTSYNISGDCELTNNQLIAQICLLMDEYQKAPVGTHQKLIRYVQDRPGHDFRYAMNAEKTQSELGWKPEIDLESGLRETVLWYLARF